MITQRAAEAHTGESLKFDACKQLAQAGASGNQFSATSTASLAIEARKVLSADDSDASHRLIEGYVSPATALPQEAATAVCQVADPSLELGTVPEVEIRQIT